MLGRRDHYQHVNTVSVKGRLGLVAESCRKEG